MSSKLEWDIDTLFLYLSRATRCISKDDRYTVFNDMAYKLMEWDNVSRCELRDVFNKFGCEFKELCAHCFEELKSCETIEEPLCEECIKE